MRLLIAITALALGALAVSGIATPKNTVLKVTS